MPAIIVNEFDSCMYITEACNSNCIMCPMSLDSRKRGLRLAEDDWKHIEELIPHDTPHITITGGEPFLEHEHLLPVLKILKEKYPYTEILILTNGRALSIDKIFQETAQCLTDHFCFAIPIHTMHSELHDAISQSPGSFNQTVRALEKLKHTPAKIEIRIVGHQMNISSLSETFMWLADSDLRINTINLIAMEMTGCAARNRDSLWVDYDRLCIAAKAGIQYAVLHNIDVGLYNFPLCNVPHELWPLTKHSITPSKIRYPDACCTCRERHSCGGLFYSTCELGLCKVKSL